MDFNNLPPEVNSVSSPCGKCANKSICKFCDQAELTVKALDDISKHLEAQHFSITMSCPDFRAMDFNPTSYTSMSNNIK